MTSCSVVIPVHNRAGLTRKCLEAILETKPRVSFEIVVVDDGSTDSTQRVLADFGPSVRVISRGECGGFSTACNHGAAAVEGENLLFLNNDTVPTAGWLDALVDHAERQPDLGVVGSKLLFANDTIQHAGVVICQDGLPRHLYAGLPADHPAVSRPRRFQAVTAACALVRREVFEQVGGFDTAYHNSLEDVDLCLRLGELGWKVHYCPDSVLYHLESLSRPRRSPTIEASIRRFRHRWGGRVRADDFDCYLQDGLLRPSYTDSYPFGLEVSAELAFLDAGAREAQTERELRRRSRQVVDLLKETARLTAHVADLEVVSANRPAGPPTGSSGAPELPARAHEIELAILELQEVVADEAAQTPREGAAFEASSYLTYRRGLRDLDQMVSESVRPGATMLVVSRGDDELLGLAGRQGWHFPQTPDGTYAGHAPAESGAAIRHLEELREQGAEYLLFPSTALWWLEHYAGLRHHLKSNYPEIARRDAAGAIFRLETRGQQGGAQEGG